jgi:hypothetical protein
MIGRGSVRLGNAQAARSPRRGSKETATAIARRCGGLSIRTSVAASENRHLYVVRHQAS